MEAEGFFLTQSFGNHRRRRGPYGVSIIPIANPNLNPNLNLILILTLTFSPIP